MNSVLLPLLLQDEIRKFLQDQLKSEEDRGLTACLVIQTLNKDHDKVKVCVDTLTKYLDNIITNPDDEKFRKIRKSNKAFVDRVAAIEGTDVFISAAGFESAMIEDQVNRINLEKLDDHLVIDSPLFQEYWKFPDYLLDEPDLKADTLEKLMTLKDALNSAEPIQAELDRGIKVLLPTQASSSRSMDLPPDFFSLTAEEIKREQQAR